MTKIPPYTAAEPLIYSRADVATRCNRAANAPPISTCLFALLPSPRVFPRFSSRYSRTSLDRVVFPTATGRLCVVLRAINFNRDRPATHSSPFAYANYRSRDLTFNEKRTNSVQKRRESSTSSQASMNLAPSRENFSQTVCVNSGSSSRSELDRTKMKEHVCTCIEE